MRVRRIGRFMPPSLSVLHACDSTRADGSVLCPPSALILSAFFWAEDPPRKQQFLSFFFARVGWSLGRCDAAVGLTAGWCKDSCLSVGTAAAASRPITKVCSVGLIGGRYLVHLHCVFFCARTSSLIWFGFVIINSCP